MRKQIQAQSATLATDQSRIDSYVRRAGKAERRLEVIRGMIAELREDDLRRIMTDEPNKTWMDVPAPN